MPIRSAALALAAAGLTLLSVLAEGGGAVLAQTLQGTIRGRVVDPSGALVPGAVVTILNENTNVTVFDGLADRGGVFVAAQVVPGRYRLTVAAPGLKTTVIDNLVASVSQVATIDVIMQIGSTSERVTVSSNGEQLDRSTSNLSTVIAPSQVQSLPLQSRNVENLLTFIPGVIHGGSATQVNTIQLSINGSRTLNTEVLLNGVSVITAATGAPVQLPSPDGIDELRLLTSNAPAEYGRTSGAVLAANTRSGTSALHGGVYSLVRNEALDANSYFNKLRPTALPRGRDRYFQVGGSLGGPVLIPALYDGHDRTFFFVNYDRTIQLTPNTVSATVPTLAQRNGDFSGVESTTPIIDPATGKPFPNNRITGIDSAAAKIIALLPLPNTPGVLDAANDRAINNYVFQQTTQLDQLRLVARGDQTFGARGRLSLNFYRDKSQQPLVTVFRSSLLNSNYDCTCTDASVASADYVHTFTPRLVADFSMGFFRYSVFRNPPSRGLGVGAQLGIARLPLDQTPTLSIAGLSSIGSDANSNLTNITNTFTPYGTVTRTIGTHTFKLGASLRKNQFNSFNPSGFPNGNLSFTGEITSSTKAAGNPNNAFADFLLGRIKTGNYQVPMPETGRRNFNIGAFFQDDWRATPKLTINAGLRYEYESPVKIANDVYSRFDPGSGTLLAAGINASASLNIKTPKLNFSPRIGFAYSIDQKTVIRGAFGTFYGTILQNFGGQVAFPGFDVTQTYPNLGTGIAQPFTLAEGLSLMAHRDLRDPFAALRGATVAKPFTIPGVEYDQMPHIPMVEQYNLGVQRKLPLAFTVEVNYVGNHALHLPTTIPVNLVPLNAVDAVTLANTTSAAQAVKPYPNLSSWTVLRQVGSSNYNSLQMTLRRQFTSSLAVLSNYTYSKSLDDGSSIYNFSAPNGTANSQYPGIAALRERDYAVSSIDATHTVNVAVVYSSNFGPRILRGFHIAPVFVGQTGFPLNITQSNLFSNAAQQRPNGSARGLRIAPQVNGSSIQYLQSPLREGALNPAFPLTPSGPQYATINGVRTRIVASGLGDLPRNALRGPGEIQFDASVSKSFPVYRALSFQLRVDAFNVINHTNFIAPNTSLANANTASGKPYFNSPSFGQITSAQPPRQLQLVGRFDF